MGVRNGGLTGGDGNEHLSGSPSSVCRSSWPWFCKICAVGCLNIAGVIDLGGGLQVRVDLQSTEPPSRDRLGNLTFETESPKFSEDVLFISDCIGMDLPTEGFELGR